MTTRVYFMCFARFKGYFCVLMFKHKGIIVLYVI